MPNIQDFATRLYFLNSSKDHINEYGIHLSSVDWKRKLLATFDFHYVKLLMENAKEMKTKKMMSLDVCK